MLRLPQFDVALPTTLDAAVTELARPGARLVAGGTDILPNLKHKLDTPERLVSLRRVRGLAEVVDLGESLRIGAGITLAALSEHPTVKAQHPALADAAGRVASPLIRNSATLGGNVNLDTRCRYVNQSEFWREAIGGGCLKSEGNVCHVVPGGRNCVAAMSSDTVPVLIALGASIELMGSTGVRQIPLVDYFHADGIAHTTRASDEITTALIVPKATAARRARYVKWSVRESIDFPLVSAALCFDLDVDGDHGVVQSVRVVVGVLGARPRVVTKLDEAVGKKLSDPAVARIVSEQVHAQCKPLENVPFEAAYRRHMLRVLVRRGVETLAGQRETRRSGNLG
jgi:4-hydroxybenzoyl-CoA reductase beta subunit